MRLIARFQGREHTLHSDRQGADLFQLEIDDGPSVSLRLIHREGNRLVLQLGDQVIDALITRDGDQVAVHWAGQRFELELESYRDHLLKASGAYEHDGLAIVKAQMPGKIIRVLRIEGDEVEAGDGLVIVESMKMQNELKSPKSGRVVKIGIDEGQTVAAGDLLFQVE